MAKSPPKGPKGGVSMFTPGGLYRTYVYLPPEIRDQLRQIAFDRRLSVSALIAEAVDEFLDRQAKPQK